MSETNYCFYSICLIYFIFYVIFFFAFLIGVANQEDTEECHDLKYFGVAILILDAFLGLFIILINKITVPVFIVIWLFVTTIFQIAAVIIRNDSSNCESPLKTTLNIYIYVNIVPSIFTFLILLWLCCDKKENRESARVGTE